MIGFGDGCMLQTAWLNIAVSATAGCKDCLHVMLHVLATRQSHASHKASPNPEALHFLKNDMVTEACKHVLSC